MVEIKDVVKNGMLVMSLNVIAAFLIYLTRIFTARTLSVYEVGLFYAVFNFISFFTFLRNWGIDASSTRYISKYMVEGDKDKVKGIITASILTQSGLSLFIIMIMLLFSNLLLKYYFKDINIAPIFYAMIWLLLFDVPVNFFKGVFRGFKKMFWFSMVEVIQSIYVLVIFLVFLNLNSLIFANVTVGLFIGIVGWFILNTFYKYNSYKIIDLKDRIMDVLKFGFPIMLSSFGGMIISYIDVIILTYFRTIEEIGIYSMILPFAMIVLYFSRALFSYVIPGVSETHTKGEYEKIKKLVKHGYWLITLAIIPLTIGVYFSAFFIKLFFGEAYLSGTLPLQILLIGVFFYMYVTFNTQILIGIGKPQLIVWVVIIPAIVMVILSWILIPIHGMVGAALATSISYIVSFIFSLAITEYEVKKLV